MKSGMLVAGLWTTLLACSVHAQQRSPWDNVPSRVSERKQFQRLERFYRARALPLDTIPLSSFYRSMAIEKQKEAGLAAHHSSNLSWEPLGPGGISYVFPAQWGTCSGRIRALAVHPTNPSLVYAGAASGGIWRTDDGGENWTDLSTDLATMSFCALGMDPANPTIIYAGTGEWMQFFTEGLYAAKVYGGNGLYKSTDAGSSWTHITNGFGSPTFFSSVKVSPFNSNIVNASLAGGSYFLIEPNNEGFWRSTDAGITWARTLNVNDGFDILPHPTIPGRVYGASGGGTQPGSAGGFYVSTDDGATWAQSNTGLPHSNDIWRIQIALAPTSPSTVYALVYSADFVNIQFVDSLRLYKSSNDGATWSQVSPFFQTLQGYYDLLLGVNPANANEVFIGDENLRRSTDGGSTFSFVGGEYFQQSMHVDFHVMAFAPSNPDLAYIGSDGGVYARFVGQWLHRNNGLRTIQFYRLSSHPADPSVIIGGSQDNGHFRTLTGGTGSWDQILVGDGMESFFSPTGPDTVYAARQLGSLSRSASGGAYGTFTSITPPWSTERRAFITPFLMHPQRTTWIYAASTRPYRSTDAGLTWAPLVAAPLTPARINSMDISRPLPDNMILTASEFTDVPTVWISSDGGTMWEDRTTNLPGPPRYIERVVCHPTQPATMFVVRSGFGSGKIYRTTDLGLTWTNISGDLPDIPHNDLFVDPEIITSIYAANDFGVYLTTDDGITWTRQGTSMPYVPVMDFSYAAYDTARYLRVGTHGRSAFQAVLPEPTSVAEAGGVPLEFKLHQNYPNPFNSATTIEFSIHHAGNVTLKVFNVLGQDLATLIAGPLPGGKHRVRWDAAASPSGIYFCQLQSGEFITRRKILLLK